MNFLRICAALASSAVIITAIPNLDRIERLRHLPRICLQPNHGYSLSSFHGQNLTRLRKRDDMDAKAVFPFIVTKVLFDIEPSSNKQSRILKITRPDSIYGVNMCGKRPESHPVVSTQFPPILLAKVDHPTQVRIPGINSIQEEVRIAMQLQSPFIIKSFGSICNPKSPHRVPLLQEYAQGGDMIDLLRNAYKETGIGIPESSAKKLFAQMVMAVMALHRRGFVHRDLKPESTFSCAFQFDIFVL